MNRWRTRSLFVETITAQSGESFTPTFTLAEVDSDEGHLSLKRLYLEAGDVTEYNFAVSVFGSYDCWSNLCECEWFKPHVEAWRNELPLLLQARAIEAARISDDPLSFNKNKWLYDAYRNFHQSGEKSGARKRGRPSKEEIRRIAVEEARSKTTTAADAERLGLTLVK